MRRNRYREQGCVDVETKRRRTGNNDWRENWRANASCAESNDFRGEMAESNDVGPDGDVV